VSIAHRVAWALIHGSLVVLRILYTKNHRLDMRRPNSRSQTADDVIGCRSRRHFSPHARSNLQFALNKRSRLRGDLLRCNKAF